MTTLRPLVFACVLFSAAVASAQPRVKVVVRTPPPLLAGQQIQIDVQVYVPNFFMSSPRFPVLNVPGAVVTMPDESGLNLNGTFDGESYTGIQKTYVLVASAAGKYTLPPAALTFRYAAEPGKPTDASVTLPPTIINIEWPAGMTPPTDGGSALVAKITLDQQLDRDPATLHVGDALTRTIVATAVRTPAMFIPPPAFTAPNGVRVYPKDPVLSDERQDRVGLVAGHRTDRVVYTFEESGKFVLPAIDVAWFNVAAKREDTATGKAITVVVAPATVAAAIAPEAPPAPPPAPVNRRRLILLGIAVVAVFVLTVATWRFANRIFPPLVALLGRTWSAIRKDRARHLPPLNPTADGSPSPH